MTRLIAERTGTILPGEPGYDEARKALNPALDPHPAIIVDAAAPADVRAAVAIARDRGLPLAVQATGHGTHVAADGAVLLRTSRMNQVEIDPDRRVARVRPGARWGQVIDAAAPYGLAPLAGSSRDVGVAGFTLGGGVGWLSRKYGLAADSLLRAEVVTADAEPISTDDHPDLLWALRGGGGSYGVVTGLEVRLHEVPVVHAGIVPFADLDRYRDWVATAPGEVSTALIISPEGVKLKVMYAGDDPERVLGPLGVSVEPMAFGQAVMGGTPARHLDFFHELSDEVMAVAVRAGEQATVEIRHWGGAIARHAGPVAAARASFSVIVSEPLPGLAEALAPHATGGSFLNFLADTSRTRQAFTGYDRLAAVKRAYDPGNLFSVGHTVS
ncbi:FAD-binding oxidoreductase [Thermoactinospora rubra]|uniref:FAD-binding oxidoreductase n=1 Tax=Thermoactinospora rubra TaxID=1088767 RepID=UPI000A121AA3|nr:FAD-dependent oxidoreductase [Thermoactinospora rubra]